jgi:hypothetical protein
MIYNGVYGKMSEKQLEIPFTTHRISFCLVGEVPQASAPGTGRSKRKSSIGGNLPGERLSIVGDGSETRSYQHLCIRPTENQLGRDHSLSVREKCVVFFSASS